MLLLCILANKTIRNEQKHGRLLDQKDKINWEVQSSLYFYITKMNVEHIKGTEIVE